MYYAWWHIFKCVGGWVVVLNATFNNISAILWRSVLLVEETGVPGEITNHLFMSRIRTHKFSGDTFVGTDCMGSCKSNYHTITITTALQICNMRVNVIWTFLSCVYPLMHITFSSWSHVVDFDDLTCPYIFYKYIKNIN